ncbi:MAG: choice-of-anchor B family protein [Chlorobia bacterium]|nr:choice-of-anchor B family protein [Fimbriimonadaceae bacterium]
MRNYLSKLTMLAVLGMSVSAHAQFARNNVRLLKQITLAQFPIPAGSGSGCVGYVSPSGKEYAIIGLSNGNAVVNITNPLVPVIVGHIPGVASQWHEVCVLGNYAYGTTEGGGGVQVIDLSQVDSGIVTLVNTITVGGLSKGHTIQAMPDSNVIIVNGGDVNGLRAYDVTNPLAPVAVGSWSGHYVHDSLIKKYTSGPYAGKEICFAFCGNGATGGLYIIDMTTTVNGSGHHVPAFTNLGYIRYLPNPPGGPNLDNRFYCHSGALSADNRYIYLNDEFDELNGSFTGSTDATTHIIDVQTLASPTYMGKFTNPISAIDHNSIIQDGFLVLAAYKQGIRIYDTSNPVQLKESGYFDTHSGTGFQFAGAWGTWAGFPSGNAIISDMQEGLIIVDPSEAKGWGAPILSVSLAGTGGVADAAKKLKKADGSVVPMSFPSMRGSMTVNLQTDSLNKSLVDFTFRARSTSPTPEIVSLYAVNQVTGAEVLLSKWNVPTGLTEKSFTNLSGPTYIKADSTMTLRVIINTSRRSGAVNLEFDQVKAFVHN